MHLAAPIPILTPCLFGLQTFTANCKLLRAFSINIYNRVGCGCIGVLSGSGGVTGGNVMMQTVAPRMVAMVGIGEGNYKSLGGFLR